MNTLADLTGVPASTISRIESGKLDPTYSMLRRIVQAVGYSLEDQVTESGSDQPIANYLDRLLTSGRDFVTAPIRDLLTTASLAPISKRKGLRRIELEGGLAEVFYQLNQQEQKPIVSSLEAFFGSIAVLQSFIPILYLNDPASVTGFKDATMRSTQIMFLLATTDNVRSVAKSKKTITMVSPEWGLIDALASPGRQPDATLELIGALKEAVA